MLERTKKLLLTLLFIAVVIGIGAILYFVFFRQPTAPTLPTEPTVPTVPTVPGLPTAAEGVIVPGEVEPIEGLPISAIADGGLTATAELAQTIGASTLSADGRSINYYDQATGKFFRIDENGNKTELSSRKFPNAEDVTWDKQGEQVVVEFPDGANIVYNFQTGRQVTLPKHWEEFDFSPTGSQVAAKSLGLDPGNRWMVLASTDGSTAKSIIPLGTNEDKVDVSWSPNDSVVGFSTTGTTQTGFGRQQILPLGKNNENYKGLIVEGLNFNSLWSPSGAQIIYDVSGERDNYKPMLWLVKGEPGSLGDNRRSLGLNTWAEKCTFSGETTLYCAVPNGLPDNSGIQPSKALGLDDTVYKIDLSTFRMSVVGTPSEGHTMNNLNVTADGRNLFYTDLRGNLHKMQLR